VDDQAEADWIWAHPAAVESSRIVQAHAALPRETEKAGGGPRAAEGALSVVDTKRPREAGTSGPVQPS